MFFNFNTVTQWIDNLLGSVMPGWAATLVECVLVALAVITLYAVFAIILIIYGAQDMCVFPVPPRPYACRKMGKHTGSI